MSWAAYPLVFRLESPLHVGWRKTGNLMQTRTYVPGRIFWGAVTANFTRCQKEKDYEEAGKSVKNHLRFGYFFLAENPEKPYLPHQKNSDVFYGDEELTETAFQRKFISSSASTVIATDSFAAQEGSLHEVEFISPFTIPSKFEESKPVFLVGHLFFKPDNDINLNDNGITICDVSLFDEVIQNLQIGGERRYGFGKISLYKNKLKKEYNVFGYPLLLNGEFPEITVPKDKPFLAHTCIDNVSAFGEIEPLVSREWAQNSNPDKSGPGHQIKKLGICYSPGSIADTENKFNIGQYGIWRAVNSS